jgi:hypothetical protein
MAENDHEERAFLRQTERLLALAIYAVVLVLLCRMVTGKWFPEESGQKLWLVSGLGLWFFALISAPWFRPPRDSLANAVSAALLLTLLDFRGVPSLAIELSAFRWVAVALAILTSLAAVVAMVLRDSDPVGQPRRWAVSRVSLRLSDSLGRGEVVFTPAALLSIIGYYQAAPAQQLWLLFVWVVLVCLRPVEVALRLVRDVRRLAEAKRDGELVGTIARVDHPNIVRVALATSAEWSSGSPVVACLPGGDQVRVLPLFHHIHESQVLGTGLCCGVADPRVTEGVPGHVYKASAPTGSEQLLSALSGVDGNVEIVGFVIEGSSISIIKFEVSPSAALSEGTLVFCQQDGKPVYYQILDAVTAEESFEANPRGKHVAVAPQLGLLDTDKGFVKYGWVPAMNCPVFRPVEPIGFAAADLGELELGRIPGSQIGIHLRLHDLLEFHGAIIGATGTGKTECALDIIRTALAAGVKVFCVDFTGEYAARLSDHEPRALGLSPDEALELDQQLFAVETGTYGAKEERKALKSFIDQIRKPVEERIDEFLSPEGAALGIFELPEITNTKATLRATELYLSTIMAWARAHRRARSILIVLEEAHTIIPETAWAGFDDDTRWVVGRIAQIALQGRKYGVGLLIVSQRTALVSKSILSQCNTHITFSVVDKTSLEYLANVYGPEHVSAIPNLAFLSAMTYGKAVLSERPVLVEIPYDNAKKVASEALNRPLPPTA